MKLDSPRYDARGFRPARDGGAGPSEDDSSILDGSWAIPPVSKA